MAQEQQPQRPKTYGDLFDNLTGEIASLPITKEDASLMQSVEALGYGGTRKGGAASMMQSAAERNVKAGLVEPSAHSDAAEHGMSLEETIIDGQVQDKQYVGDQSVLENTDFIPTLPEAAATRGVTIGEALEGAAIDVNEKLVDASDARAIQSAEARAIGVSFPVKGGIGAAAQSAAQKNADGGHVTLGDILKDATEKLMADKVVTQEDVERVKRAEKGGDEEGGGEVGGGVIYTAMQSAVDLNEEAKRYIEANSNTTTNTEEEGYQSIASIITSKKLD